MRKIPTRSDGARLDLTPMIDVTFLLLVFFLCTLRFQSLEAKLAAHLPRDVGGGAAHPAHPERIDLSLRARADAGGARALEYRLGPRRASALDALLPALAELRAARPDRGVALHVGEDVTTGEVVHVLDALVGLGLGDVAFAPVPAASTPPGAP